jgi:DNA-binding NarL/FixJ family response regulator
LIFDKGISDVCNVLILLTITMSTTEPIKVAIADDHKIFRDGIRMALSGKDYLKIIWEAEDGKDLMHKIKIKMPNVLLMDIRMAGDRWHKCDLSVTERIRGAKDHCFNNVR